MNLLSILKESLLLLKKQPKAFIPKFITTGLYSFSTLWVAQLTVRAFEVLARGGSGAAGILAETPLLIVFATLLYFIDIVSYAMYPSIVKDYNENKPVSLKHALADALKAWSMIVTLGLLIPLVAVVMAVVIIVTYVLAVQLSLNILFYAGILLALLFAFAFSMAVFFTIPVAVVEKKSMLASFWESINLSFKHKGDLFRMNAVFLLLILATLALSMLSDFKGLAGVLSIAVFIVVRLLQAIVYTYLSVVNPYFYVQARKTD
jgi:hypothetical protein